MSSSSYSTGHGYQPLSPPWTPHASSPQTYSTRYERAPAMPYIPLPPCDEPYGRLLTPPPTPPRVHPVLTSKTTVVRYDFATDPRTIRMSSSSPQTSFPSRDPASSPSIAVLYIECEVSGHVVTIQRSTGVTSADVLVQLHRFFDRPISSADWHNVRGTQREAMKVAYSRRTGHAYDRTAQMKMVDYLLGQSIFQRVVPKHNDASGTSMWLLQTTS